MKKFLAKVAAVATVLVTLMPAMSAQALTISPPYVDYRLNPGDTVLDVVKVYNEDTAPNTFHVQVMNFTSIAGEETGTPTFYPATEKRDGTDLAKWITVTDPNKTYTLAPKERANIPIAINIPKDAQPGAHYGAVLMASGKADEKGGTVGVETKLGSLIFVNVSGDLNETGRILDFSFKDKKVWYNMLPIDFFMRFENDGNTNLRPAGNVFIKNWYGRQVASIKVNDQFGSVLPHSIRKFGFGWGAGKPKDGGFFAQVANEWNNFGFGRYQATLFVNYGSNNQTLSEVRYFTVWPWRLMTLAGIALLVVILFFTVGMKGYNKAVIRRYERKMKK